MKDDIRRADANRVRLGTRLTRYLLFSLAIALIVEIALRLIRPEALIFVKNAREILQSHPVWKTDYRPNSHAHFYLRSWSGVTIYDFTIAANEHGFRVGSRQIDNRIVPDPSKTFVHAIGDSFTQGWGVNVEVSFPDILDDMLDTSTQVLNLGLNGLGVIGATEKSMTVWDRFPAKHAVYLFTTSDFSDDYDAVGRSSFVKQVVVPIADTLRRHVYLANLPFYVGLFHVWKEPLNMTIEEARNAKQLSPRLDQRLVDLTGSDWKIVGDKSEVEPARVRASLEALQKYADFVRVRGASLLVVAMEAKEHEIKIENAAMKEFCARHGIPFLHLYASDALRLYREGHLNKLGNARLAEKISAWLQPE